jgi:arabinogalactan oligomer/maltooligosaccharide transport system substrate-binding protein
MVLSCFVGCGLFGNNHTHDFKNGKCECGETDPNYTPVANPLAGTYKIEMWVSEKASEDGTQSVAKQMEAQIADFMAANPGIIIEATISGVTEADAGSQVVADVASAPDIYCFAQDQLARLVQAAALAAPGGDIAAKIKAENDAGSVAAATVAGQLYAYPMTSDNGYYLYYDKSVVTNPDSLEQIIADCEAAFDANGEHRLFRYALENGWYTASFFFGAGAHSQWTMNADGAFNGIDDNFNSEIGLVAMKGMQKLAQSRAYNSDADNFANAAAIVTGIWNAETAESHFGENFAVADLPSYTVDGKEYHLGSFSGNKLMGVKPQTDAKRGAVLQLLAQYLTSEKCQLERYEMWQWGPSNINAQKSDAVQANPSLAALAAQNAYAVPQGQIHGSWWDAAAKLGAQAKAAQSEDDLKGALVDYETTINGVLNMTDEEKNAWGVIGGICNTSWDTDIAMTDKGNGVWETDILSLVQGQEFKLRRGADWNFQIGCTNANTGDTETGFYVRMSASDPDTNNIAVEATGDFVIRLEWDGESHTAKVSLIPA